jgi:hypothetical protein
MLSATTGAKARSDFMAYAALKRRSSTVLHASISFCDSNPASESENDIA